MSKFALGFGAATLAWGAAAAYVHLGLGWGPPSDAPIDAPEALLVATAPTDEAPSPRRPRRAGRRRGGAEGSVEAAADDGVDGAREATTGDDLDEDAPRFIDGAGQGGEEQLRGDQIERTFDGGMGRIRRCFLLVESDAPVAGRLTFGLRIAGSGRVAAVQLTGPSALTGGDAGECLRDAARSLAFPTFDGPEMVVRYPIVLE